MRYATPAYLQPDGRKRLKIAAKDENRHLSCCRMCPHHCGVDRTSGETGFCATGSRAVVASWQAHFGEEAPLVGTGGSGTVFLSHCNLQCGFCQNEDISLQGLGQEVSARQLADMMLSLQDAGCHNINWVTPSHVVPQLLSGLNLAADNGLKLPVVYNTSAYDTVEALKLLDGIIDIYMPDFKFWDPDVSQQVCQAPDYPEVARCAIKEMHRQVGDLKLDRNGIAQRGILLRHLVLPTNMAGTAQVVDFVARQLSPRTYVNIMSQYRPCGPMARQPGWSRSITTAEYNDALAQARKAGLTRLDPPRRVFMWH